MGSVGKTRSKGGKKTISNMQEKSHFSQQAKAADTNLMELSIPKLDELE